MSSNSNTIDNRRGHGDWRNHRQCHRTYRGSRNEACIQPAQAPSAQENTRLIGAPDVAIQTARLTAWYTHYVVCDRANCRIYELLDGYRSWPGLGERGILLETADDRSRIYGRNLEEKINAYIRDHYQSQGTLPLGRWLIRNDEDGSLSNGHDRPGANSLFGSTGNYGVMVPHQCYSRPPCDFPRQERFWCAPYHPGPCNVVDGDCLARHSNSDNIEPTMPTTHPSAPLGEETHAAMALPDHLPDAAVHRALGLHNPSYNYQDEMRRQEERPAFDRSRARCRLRFEISIWV